MSTPLDTALKLSRLGYWAIAIRAPGETIWKRNPRYGKDPDAPKFLERPATGKDPVGKAWGLERWPEERLRTELARPAGRGVGIGFGPERGPGGAWLIDLEGDGPQAAESLAKLLGGEVPETPGWSSTRGDHTLFIADGERLLLLLAAAGAREGTGTKAGVWHLPELPGLELRIGGFKEDGTTVKQVQSVVPPTPGTDGTPRAWTVTPKTPVAPLPEAAYATLERIAAAKCRSIKVAQERLALGTGTHPGYGQAALASEAVAFASKPPGERHDYLLRCTLRLASLVKAGALSEGEVLAALHTAARSNGMEAEGRATEVDDLWASAMEKAGPRSIKDRTPGPAPSGKEAGSRVPRESQAEILLRLAGAATLFHDPAGCAYAAVPIDKHTEVHAIGSNGFRRWLKYRFYVDQDHPPAAQSLQDALGVIESKAVYEGPEEAVFVRVAGDADRIIIDLGDSNWQVVVITAAGWNVRNSSPVRFRRPANMRPLPIPQHGGSIDRIKPFINSEPGEFLLIVAWLAAALRPRGTYPALVLTGEQGSAKSTLARLLRSLIDPHVSLLRCEPKECRDLMVGAVNNWVVALDNLSTMHPWLSDALCRLSTGGGFAARTHYSNDEETILDAKRPMILTGITDFVSRGDLIDRCLFLHLPTIPEDKRRTEEEFWADFEQQAPWLLGALLDVVAGGLRRLPEVISRLPRMADFARFGEAVSRALGNPPDGFLSTYRDNRQAANESALEDSPVAGAVKELASRGPWTGTSTELLSALGMIVDDKVAKSESWPKSPRGMSGAIRRLAPALRMVRVDVVLGRAGSKARTRVIAIRPTESGGERPSEPSEPSDNGASDCSV